MKTLFQFSILIILLFISCKKTSETTTVQETTPEVFNEDTKISLDSYSLRKNEDLIDQLFKEAIQNDPSLKNLMTDIYAFDSKKEEDLKSYYAYKSFDQNYKNAYNNLVNRIKDSTLKIETKQFFDKAIQKQNEKNNPLMIKEELLLKKTSELNDKMVLMKLMVTYTMMEKYWDNEKPKMEIFDKPDKELDTLINRTKAYTTFEK